MPKLLWVTLPLLILALLAGWLAWRRRTRPPAWRQALNVWSSLLLLAYLATTAGLGIFWVANQQLPVFDWHYLFGYLTLALLVLHLSLNFGQVWRFLTRPGRGAPASGSAPATGRRPALRAIAGLGLLGAIGAGFGIVLRQGRREPGPAVAGAADVASPPAPAGLAAVEHYHGLSGHSRSGLLLRAPALDWGAAPPSFKRYPRAERIALPPPGTPSGAGVDLAALGATLWHTAGVTATRGGLQLRASPSSGALFATELYVASSAVGGLAPALWHYDAQAHALERLGQGAPEDAALGALAAPALQGAAACIVATAVFARTGHKYRERSYRYVLADLGHALENLSQAAVAAGAEVGFVAAFDEARVAATLGLDEGEEGVLALVALRPPGAPVAPVLPPPTHAPAPEASARGPLAAVHAATSLRAGASPAPATTAPAAPPSAAGALRLPPAAASAGSVFELIRTRRSVRRFTSTALAPQALAGVLAAMSASQAARLSTAVRVYVVVNRVNGVPAGAYRHDPIHQALLLLRGPADLRAAAQAAAFDQEAIGGAAAVFVLTIDRIAFAADPHGPARGYRHAFLEAGRVGERIYLEAGARGLGVCAVGAFYDAEATALLATDAAREWVVHFAALGAPAH